MKNHHTKQKGDLGVLKAMCSLCEQHFDVLLPQTEHASFDIVAHKDGKFSRIQVKYRSVVNGKIEIPLATSWADKNGNHRNHYTDVDIDAFCVYCPQTDKCYFINMTELIGKTSTFTFRIEPPKSGQRKNIRLAEDYIALVV